MPVLRHIGLLVNPAENLVQDDVQRIPDAAIAWKNGRIDWTGPEKDLPEVFRKEVSYSADGKTVIPGLVDCHTHLAFAGWRADEFELRLKGHSYLEIAKKGGGIMRTVEATRAASFDDLKKRACGVLEEMAKLGITTVECKSGYGLNTETELRLLHVYKALALEQPVHLVSTFLGAHTIPAEFKKNRTGYLDLILHDMLPKVIDERLARFCDAFVEETAFTTDEAERVLLAAKLSGMHPKIHADQMSGGHGAELAGRLKAVSADHLECVTHLGMSALKEAATIAVSLPVATLYLQQRPLPARELIRHQIPVAVATDFNPGTAPTYHLPYAMHLACVMQRMTPDEVFKGATLIAAAAIREETRRGSLAPGKTADFAVLDIPDLAHWFYHFRPNVCLQTWIGGEKIWDANQPFIAA